MKKTIKMIILLMTLTVSTLAQIPSTLPATNGSVLATISDGSGGLYIAGSFTTVGGASHTNVAHIKSDGTVDATFVASTNNTVYALALSGTNLFIGGQFTQVNGVTKNFFAALNSSTGSTIGGVWNMGYDGYINFMTINSGILYVGGAFTTMVQSTGTSFPRQHLGSVTISTGVPTSFNPTPGGTVYSMQFSGSTPGLVFIGGSLTAFGGSARTNLAAYNINSSTLYAWNPTTNGPVGTMALVGNTLFVGGQFSRVNGTVVRNNAAAFTVTSTNLTTPVITPTSWDVNTGGSNGSIISMADNGGTLYITGAFTTVGGNSRLGFAAVDETSGTATALTHSLTGTVTPPSGFTVNLEGYSLITSGTNIAIGGIFANADGNASQGLAAFSTVIKTAQSITFGSLASQTYGNANFTLSATASSGLTVTYSSDNTSVATVTGNTVTIVGAGTANITASQAGDATYAAATPVSQALVVSKASLIATADNKSKTYGAANPTFTISYSGFVGSDNASSITQPTASTTATTSTGAGTATITLTGGSAANYNLTLNNGTLTINKATLQAISDSKSKVYGAKNPNWTITYVGFVNGDNAASLTTAPKVDTTNLTRMTPVSVSQIPLSGGVAANYTFDYSTFGYLTVTPAPLTITANNLSKVYGAANPKLTKSFVGFVNNEDSTVLQNMPTISTLATATSNVGSYAITLTATGSNPDGNYNVTLNNGTLTVNKADQTITFGTLTSKKVGDANFTLSATASSGLTVTYSSDNTSVATVMGSTVTIVGAGTANITASQAGNSNYNAATDVSQSLTVTTLTAQSITFGTLASKTYGDANFTLGATASSGLTVTYVSSDPTVASINGSTVTILSAGTTTITASQSGDATYAAASDVAQTLTVNKADQTITFNTLATVLMTTTSINLSATSTSGLTVTYSSSDPTVALVSGNVVTILKAGTTTITASQAGNSNYNAAADATQKLTVNKVDQTITFNSFTVSNSFTLSATSTSGLVVTFTSSDPTIASISGNTVTVLKAGTVTITASQAGNNIYNAAADVQQTFTSVVTGIEPINTVTFSMYPNPTSEVLTIETDDNTAKAVAIYSMDGRLMDTVQSNEKEIKIVVSNYTNGIYIAKVMTQSGQHAQKFVKN